ncbi:acyltransferase [Microvirga sp. W0021]|uniref:Acyltransferase n=1 Tax=Hohaiivirga grylli TaxID=3133970 RepID=A0ABV0BIN5_9HYPH
MRQNLNIQALRAIAALLVVIGHSFYETMMIASTTGQSTINYGWFNWGIGVDIFFVISGFIMVYSSHGLFNQPNGWQTFLVRRLIRIIPLYWLLTTAMIAGALVIPSLLNVPLGNWQYIISSYFFIPAVRAAGEIRPVLSLGWTLNMEMFFYILFAVALFFPIRYGIAFLTAIMVSLALYGLFIRPEQTHIAFWTQSLVLEFIFGCLLAVAYLKNIRLGGISALIICAVGLIGMINIPALSFIAPEAIRWGIPALLIVSAVALCTKQVQKPLFFLVALGNASYSLYLVHPFVLRPLRNIWMSVVGDTLPLIGFVILAALLSSLVAIVLYRLFEEPSNRFLRDRLLNKKSGTQAAFPENRSGITASLR